MHFYARLAVLCLSAVFGTAAFGQTATNLPASPTLTPEAEQRAREILNSLGGAAPAPAGNLAAPAPVPVPATDASREMEVRRIEAEVERARQRRQPQVAPVPSAPAPIAPAQGTLTPEIEAQVRALLDQKTAELQARPAPAAPATPAFTPQPLPVPASIAPAPAVATVPVPAPAAHAPTPSLSEDQEAAARYILDQKTTELQMQKAKPIAVQPALVPAPAAPVVAPVVSAVPAPEVVATAPAPQPALEPARVPSSAGQLTAEQEIAARAALEKTAVSLQPARVEKRPEQKAPAVAATTMVRPVALTPRAQKLAVLLEAYKADRITPAEYHAERAKILAETAAP